MKKFFPFLSIAVLAMSVMVCTPAMSQTRKEKKAAKRAQWEYEQKVKELERQHVLDSLERANAQPKASAAGTSFDVPCMKENRSDKEFFRQLGIGEDMDLALAQQKALQNAKSRLRDRLGEQVKGLVTDYTKTYSKSNQGQDVNGIVEREFTNLVEGVLRDADNVCEQPTQMASGSYRYYYVIEVAKKEITEKVADAISNDAKLRADFDRERFRKFANEYMSSLKESEEK